MQNKVSEMVAHMAHSSADLARMLEAERDVAVRMSEIVQSIPDRGPEFDGLKGILDSSEAVAQNLIAYLNMVAELQETIAAQLTFAMRELKEADEE